MTWRTDKCSLSNALQHLLLRHLLATALLLKHLLLDICYFHQMLFRHLLFNCQTGGIHHLLFRYLLFQTFAILSPKTSQVYFAYTKFGWVSWDRLSYVS